MRSRAQLVNTPRLHIPLARLALCVDCEVCFEIGPDQCPACGSRTWSALSRFIGDASEKAVVRAVHALVEEARGLSEMPGGQHHLLIVSQEQPKLFQTLKNELRDNRSITVILDRRSRGATTARIPNQRWRHVDHQLKALGWAIVRSEKPAGRALERERSALR